MAAELKEENDRLELELSNSTSVSAAQKAELIAIKEKVKDVTDKCKRRFFVIYSK